MSREFSRTLINSRSLIGSLIALLMTAAVLPAPVNAQYASPARYSNDFGAAPDDYYTGSRNSYDSFNAGRDSFQLDEQFNDRNDYRTNARTRDPVYPSRYGDDFDTFRTNNNFGTSNSFGTSSSYGNGFDDFQDLPPRTNRAPQSRNGFDNGSYYDDYAPRRDERRYQANRAPVNNRYAPVNRPYDVEDLPRPPRNDWNQPAPQLPTQPVAHPEPTLQEKVTQRYNDPKVVRMLQGMNQSNGEALFAEVSQYIDQRHIQPTSYQQRVQTGIESLQLALQTPGFQQALGIRSDAQTIRSVQQNLGNLSNQSRPQDMNQAVGVMRQAGQMVSQSLGVNPGAACLEFVYGSLSTLDKFSMLVAPEKSGGPSVGIESNMVGIGVEIEAHPQGLMILKALSGGPAAASTLQRGDIITAVDGRSVAGMSLDQAVDLIAGANGTPVQLKLRRDNMIGDVTIVRRSFEVKSVSEVRMEANNVGYIKLDQFAQTSAQEIDEALWKLHNEGMQSLILDLRGNPGGLLTTAIEISNRFLPSGTIVSTRGRNANDNSQETASRNNTWKTPLVVLVDHNSASASEILAAAIQENDRGLIVGERSYGKGTVQTLFPMQSVPSALRLTTAKFYSPDGREMAGAGVTPDVTVATMSSDRAGNDSALQAALRAATDPRVQEMATKSAKLDVKTAKVIRVEI